MSYSEMTDQEVTVAMFQASLVVDTIANETVFVDGVRVFPQVGAEMEAELAAAETLAELETRFGPAVNDHLVDYAMAWRPTAQEWVDMAKADPEMVVKICRGEFDSIKTS